MTIDALFSLSDALDRYIAALDIHSPAYERAVMVNNDVVACLAQQVKEDEENG